jgi:hypothetical protein
VIDPRATGGLHSHRHGHACREDGVLRTSDPDIAVPLAEIFG